MEDVTNNDVMEQWKKKKQNFSSSVKLYF